MKKIIYGKEIRQNSIEKTRNYYTINDVGI